MFESDEDLTPPATVRGPSRFRATAFSVGVVAVAALTAYSFTGNDSRVVESRPSTVAGPGPAEVDAALTDTGIGVIFEGDAIVRLNSIDIDDDLVDMGMQKGVVMRADLGNVEMSLNEHATPEAIPKGPTTLVFNVGEAPLLGEATASYIAAHTPAESGNFESAYAVVRYQDSSDRLAEISHWYLSASFTVDSSSGAVHFLGGYYGSDALLARAKLAAQSVVGETTDFQFIRAIANEMAKQVPGEPAPVGSIMAALAAADAAEAAKASAAQRELLAPPPPVDPSAPGSDVILVGSDGVHPDGASIVLAVDGADQTPFALTGGMIGSRLPFDPVVSHAISAHVVASDGSIHDLGVIADTRDKAGATLIVDPGQDWDRLVAGDASALKVSWVTPAEAQRILSAGPGAPVGKPYGS